MKKDDIKNTMISNDPEAMDAVMQGDDARLQRVLRRSRIPNRVQVSFKFPEPIMSELRKFCEENHVSMNAFVENLIADALHID